MKNTAYTFLLLILILSCNKTQDYGYIRTFLKGDQEYGSATAMVRGELWESSAEIREGHFHKGEYFLYMYTFEELEDILFERESISFGIITDSTAEGRYNVIPTVISGVGREPDDDEMMGGYGYLLEANDVLGPNYILDTTKANLLVIDNWDVVSGIMAGRFTLHFKSLDEDYSRREYLPLEVSFREGNFSCRVRTE